MMVTALSGVTRSDFKQGNRFLAMPKVCSIRTLVWQWALLKCIWWGSVGSRYGVIRYFLHAYPLSPSRKPSGCSEKGEIE